MLSLIASTLAISAVDSLNPIAISQQFILQGIVKKPKHIWYFILSVAAVNYAGGLLIFYGLVTPLKQLVQYLLENFAHYISILGFAAGAVCVVAAIFIFRKNLLPSRKDKSCGSQEDQTSESEKSKKKYLSVTPISLIVIGALATLSELTSALPYFAFLALLGGYGLPLPGVLAILMLYNFIYCLPFFIMYFIYIKAQDSFDRLYCWIKEKMAKLSAVLVPLAFFAAGGFLVYQSSALY